MTSPVASATNPLEGMYAFIKGHLSAFNSIVSAATTIVALLDFLAPRLSVLPTVVYSMVACLLGAMLLAPINANWAKKVVNLFGFGQDLEDRSPLWKQPAWQFLVVLFGIVCTIGFSSVAKAADGGLLASEVPFFNEMQKKLSVIEKNTEETKTTTKETKVIVEETKKTVEEIKVILTESERRLPVNLCGDHFNVTAAAEALRRQDTVAADELLRNSHLPAAVKPHAYEMAKCTFPAPFSADIYQDKACSGRLWLDSPDGVPDQLFLLSRNANCGFYVYSKTSPDDRETLVKVVRRAAEIAKEL